MFRRGQWIVAVLLATVAHAGLISQFAPAPPGGNARAGNTGVELNIQLAAPQSAAPTVRSPAKPAEPVSETAATAPKAPAATRPRRQRTTKPARETAQELAQRAGGPQGTANYYVKLQAWLNAHKNYPTEARNQGWEGVTELEFVVQSDGTVAWSRLARSSGYLMLDHAAAKLLAEAQPLPPPPAELDAAARHVRVPISYRLY